MAPGAMTIFEQAIALPVEQRGALLEALCGSRPAVRAEVERKLAQDAVLLAAEATRKHPAPAARVACILPERIGSYRVLGKIGEGSSGTVLRAEQEQPRREVALKLLQTGSVSTASMRRFVIEAEALARLQHPGVLQIFEAGVADVGGTAVPFLATELVRGLLLHEWRAAAKPDWRQCLAVVLQILDAVEYVHRQGVIHRDLKPQNVVIREGDDALRVCILDFGVARLQRSEVDTERTLQGAVVGTLAYMSPEQAVGSACVDTRSDVWSTGAICYELLTGQPPMPPFDGELQQRIAQRREAIAVPLGDVDGRFRGDLEAVVSKALATDPEERYGSASAFAEDLRRVLAHETVEAHSATVWHRVRLCARRRRAWMATLVLIALLAAASLAVMVQSYAEVRASRQRVRDVLTMVTRRVFLLEQSIGTFALRRELLLGIGTELASLAERAPDDPDHWALRADLAVALGNLEVQADRRSAARPFREQALLLRQRLAQARPEDPLVVRDLATDLVRLGDLEKDEGDPERPRASYRKAQALFERLVDDGHCDPRSLDDLAHGCNRMAHFAIEDREFAAAEQLLARQQQLLDQLLRDAPERPATMINGRSLWLMRAFLAELRGDPALQLRCLRAVLEFCDPLLDQRPADAEALFGALSARMRLAESALQSGDAVEARRLASEARDRLRRAGPNLDDARLQSLLGYFADDRWK